MQTRSMASVPVVVVLFAASLLVSSRADAQAGPGPIAPVPQSQGGQSTASAPRPPARPRQPQLPPRTTLAGSWKLNHDDSDDGRRKVRAAEGSTGENRRDPNDGYPGGGYPGGGYPGNGPWGGYPYPTGGGPSGGRLGRTPDHEDDAKMQPLVNPSESLGIDLKNPEVDMTDDQLQKLVLFTDGRPLPKSTPKDEQDVGAHWSGSHLVSDEKSPLGGKMSRTFELSQDGRQMYETLHIDNGKKTAIVIRYVYDVSRPDMEGGQDSDPDRPVLKRNSDDGSNSTQ